MKIELSAVDNLGSYLLSPLPDREVAGFEQVTACPGCATRGPWHDLAVLGGSAAEPALRLRMCGGCGHVTYDRLPAEAWLGRHDDDEWDAVRRAGKPKLEPNNRSPWAMAPHVLDLKLPPDARILDFGCGFGDGLYALQHRGYHELHGVEVGSHRVEVASRYFPGRIRHGSIEEAQHLAAEGGPFDLITCNHVAEHLRDPAEMLRALAALLRPRGVIVVSVPYPRSESPLHLPLYLSHLHHYTPASLRHMLARAGLRTWRWSRSTVQLAVAGTRNALPSGAEHYELEDRAVPDPAATMASYVAAPWQLGGVGPVTLNYFHPWSGPTGSAGFQVLDRLADRWFRGPVRWAAPVIARGERSGLDNRSLLRRTMLATSRLVLRKSAPRGGDLIRYRASASASAVPWLTVPGGGVPVLTPGPRSVARPGARG